MLYYANNLQVHVRLLYSILVRYRDGILALSFIWWQKRHSRGYRPVPPLRTREVQHFNWKERLSLMIEHQVRICSVCLKKSCCNFSDHWSPTWSWWFLHWSPDCSSGSLTGTWTFWREDMPLYPLFLIWRPGFTFFWFQPLPCVFSRRRYGVAPWNCC